MIPLQLFGINPLIELALILVVSVLTVAFGTYMGVLMALRSFFGAQSGEVALGSETE
ncbi:hypothetical protein [Haloarchaeobius amylolyticus]|uniref:hypothetical protein n=1 Tax=Haloarchaeobius amylolyticus TaxID=1198296 RepID=UPI00226E3491|nr:hypothetical protein [Haloarchaeobius amylolyticus]